MQTTHSDSHRSHPEEIGVTSEGLTEYEAAFRDAGANVNGGDEVGEMGICLGDLPATNSTMVCSTFCHYILYL